jgi:hypothetical protein
MEAFDPSGDALACEMAEHTAKFAKEIGEQMKIDYHIDGSFWRDIKLRCLITGGCELVLFRNADSVSDVMFEAAGGRILEFLDDQGYLDGMLPVNITHVGNASVGIMHIFFSPRAQNED